jgi:N-acetylglucosaminyldiphosphoundecaprenol N-acetyl-beta-D-mannosaminyltransferase
MFADSESVAGFRVTTAPFPVCLAGIAAWLDCPPAAGGRYFVCANPHSLELARVDAAFAAAIDEADLVVPDGIGVVIASRLRGGAIGARVTGSMIFAGVNGLLNSRGGSVYLVGSTVDVLDRMRARLADEFPGIRVAGLTAPPFGRSMPDEANERIVDAVNAARPDVVWVGMTAPKQEKWIHQNRHRLRVGLLGPVGAVFDFYAGTVKPSPPWFRDHGLEWLPRLIREPGRLWRRSVVSAPRFLARAVLGAPRQARDR